MKLVRSLLLGWPRVSPLSPGTGRRSSRAEGGACRYVRVARPMGSGSSISRARTPACASPAALASSTTSPRPVSSRSRRPASGPRAASTSTPARRPPTAPCARSSATRSRATGQFHSGTAIRQGNAEAGDRLRLRRPGATSDVLDKEHMLSQEPQTQRRRTAESDHQQELCGEGA